MCNWISKVKTDSSDITVKTLFYRVEALRFFKCQNPDLVSEINQEAQSVLLSPKNHVFSLYDYLFSSVLNHNAEFYNLKSSAVLDKALAEYVIEELLPNYRVETLSMKNADGLSIDTIKALKLMLTQIDDKSVGKKVEENIKKSLSKIFKEASAQSAH